MAPKRRASSFNTSRIDHIFEEPYKQDKRLILHYGDMTDSLSLLRLIEKISPDEIYNLAAQSHVAVSFESPEYTANCDALGPLRILEAVKILGLTQKTKIYQASTSELFGYSESKFQSEKTPFYPKSPYGVAKLYGYWITVNYRESYNMFACNGILFNHESPRRGATFVTKKITRTLSLIDAGKSECLYIGNLNSLRDWGHAKEYVEMQWKMLQQESPKDYVIATGRQSSVRDFINLSAKVLGWGELRWEGEGINETADRTDTGKTVVRVDEKYFRPNEVNTLLGTAELANKELGWKATITLEQLVEEMIEYDLKNLSITNLNE